MPFPTVLDRSPNVHWGGAKEAVTAFGVQISGTSIHGAVHAGRSGKESEEDWREVSSDPISWRSNAYALVGGKDGTPTFVIGGGWTARSSIIASHDGVSWTTVYNNVPGGGARGGGVQNIVWTGEQFYAIDEMQESEGTWWEAYFLSSSDGLSWSKGKGYIAFNDDEFAEKYAQCGQEFLNLCPHGIPSGYFGFDEKNDILMIPSDFEVSVIGVSCNSNSVDIIGSEESAGASFPARIAGVAFAGSVWTVLTQDNFSDPVTVHISTNNGKSWKEVYSISVYSGNGIASGAKSDIDR